MASDLPLLCELPAGATVRDLPVLVNDCEAKVTGGGKPYSRLTIADRSGSRKANCWDDVIVRPDGAEVLRIMGVVEEYKGDLQVNISRSQWAKSAAPYLDRLARRPATEVIYQRETLAAMMAHLTPEVRALVVDAFGCDPLDGAAPFWHWAAASGHHHAYPGGLAEHTLTMADAALRLHPLYPHLDWPVIFVAILCHDLGKLDTYAMGAVSAHHRDEEKLVGHTAYSLMRFQRAVDQSLCREPDPDLNFTNVLHCIAAHHGRTEWDAIVEPRTPEADLIHALDMIDSRANKARPA